MRLPRGGARFEENGTTAPIIYLTRTTTNVKTRLSRTANAPPLDKVIPPAKGITLPGEKLRCFGKIMLLRSQAHNKAVERPHDRAASVLISGAPGGRSVRKR